MTRDQFAFLTIFIFFFFQKFIEIKNLFYKLEEKIYEHNDFSVDSKFEDEILSFTGCIILSNK